MSLVLDASLTLGWYFEDERTAETDAFAWTTTLHFADRFKLGVYDAAYLELAHRQRLPLGTHDRQLRAAAATLGLALPALPP